MNSPRVGVVGLGKLGLALAGFYLSRGLTVVGSDVSERRLEQIRLGDGIASEPGLLESLRSAEREGRWNATRSTPEAVRGADVVVVVVPVHATSADDVDLSMLRAAVTDIGAGLSPGALVIIESTVPAGTTRALALPALERDGRTHGRDLWLAYSPERVSIGTVFRDLERYPKVVGGIDADATSRAAAFYRDALGLEVLAVGACESAEFVKLIETTYRDTNIALANTFALAAEDLGIDVTEAIAAANTQPYSHIHAPGIGVGGNCIPVYPYLYAASAPSATDLPLLARQRNDQMVDHAVERLGSALPAGLRGSRVLILGVTYRPGVKDIANSPALRLRSALVDAGAQVLAADPLLSDAELADLGFEPVRPPRYGQAEAVVVQALSPEFSQLDWLRATGCTVVIDGRNALDAAAIRAAGVRYLGFGR